MLLSILFENAENYFSIFFYEWIESNQGPLVDYEWAFQYNLLEMFCRQF